MEFKYYSIVCEVTLLFIILCNFLLSVIFYKEMTQGFPLDHSPYFASLINNLGDRVYYESHEWLMVTSDPKVTSTKGKDSIYFTVSIGKTNL